MDVGHLYLPDARKFDTAQTTARTAQGMALNDVMSGFIAEC
jgi:hypothetical protein